MSSCPQCKTFALSTDKFCSNCGTTLTNSASVEPFSIDKGSYGSGFPPPSYSSVPVISAQPVVEAFATASLPVYPGLMSPTVTPSPPSSPPPKGVMTGNSTVKLVLTNRGSKNAIRFMHGNILRTGGTVEAYLGSHSGQGLGRCYDEERRYGPWRYTEACCGEGTSPVRIKLVDGKYIFVEGADLCLDVSFWKYHAGNSVNWVGGTSGAAPTKLAGGGRDWVVEQDGTVCVASHRELVLGFEERINAEDMEGCYGCCCYPCGSACFRNTSEGPNKYNEAGIFFWFFVIPIPYGKTRTRTVGNRFTNQQDGNDHCAWRDKGVIRTEGPSCAFKISD